MKLQASDSEVTVAPAETVEKKEVTDKQLAVVFITFRINFTAHRGSGKTVFFFDEKEIADLLYKWQHNVPIPVPDIRDVFDALVAFNSCVRD